MQLIFDFDGTLVDSFNNVMERLNQLADEFNFKKISQDELIKLKDLSSMELIKYLKIPIYKIPSVLHKARKQMHADIQHLTPFANMIAILQKLHYKNFLLGILTSNSEKNVIAWLNFYKINHLFNFIHAESNIFGKVSALKKVIHQHKMNKSQTFYIGDETRDIDAAKENAIYSIAVTWGFNSEKILLQHKPDYIIKKPDDLLSHFITAWVNKE